MRNNKVKSFVILGLASFFLLYEFVLQISPSVMINDLMEYFHVDALAFGIASALFYYAYTPIQLVGGLLYDCLGSRTTLIIATCLCATGALCISLSENIIMLGVGRFLMGAGSGCAFVGVLFVGANWFPSKYFASIASFTELMGCMGAVIGAAPAAQLVSYYGWKHVITFLAVSGYILAVIYYLFIRDNVHKQQYIPFAKIKQNYQFSRVFKNSQIWAIGLYTLFVFAPISVFAGLWGVSFLQSKFGVTTIQAGKACCMIWIGMAIGSILLGLFSDFISKRKLPLMMSSLLGISITLVLLYSNVTFSETYLILFIFGVASSGQALSFAVIKDNVGSKNVGLAMGFNNMLAASGGAIFQPFVGYWLRLHWDGTMIDNVHHYSLSNFQSALIVLPVCYAISMAIGFLFIRETNCSYDSDTTNTILLAGLNQAVD